MTEGAKLNKVVEMFDHQGRPVSDPAQASRTVTSYYDSEGKLVRRTMGKAVIMGAPDEHPDDG